MGSISQAVSYCGLTSAQRNSAGKEQRGPISKQRNQHLQTMLIEAAKLAPRYNPQLAAVHQRELQRGDCNRATLEVARKLVAYWMAVDKSGKPFQVRAAAAPSAGDVEGKRPGPQQPKEPGHRNTTASGVRQQRPKQRQHSTAGGLGCV
jgi:hypothetical protein